MPTARRLPILPIRSLIPNALTILALSAGMSAIRFAILERWEAAVIAILVAGVFDGLDGRVARLLKGSSKFGAELDSLSDIVSFGVAPALVMYMWTLSGVKGLGWGVALTLAICMALRLARFNTMMKSDEPEAKGSKDYFTGIPAPATAALAVFPMMLYFETGYEIFKQPLFCALYVGIIAFLSVSSIPTFSFKRIAIRREYVLFYLLGIGILAHFLLTQMWITMSVIGLLYLIMIPVAFSRFRKLEYKEPDDNADEKKADEQ